VRYIESIEQAIEITDGLNAGNPRRGKLSEGE
jgi:hypothetical protein